MNRRDRSKLSCDTGVALDSDEDSSSIEVLGRVDASLVPVCDREVI